MRNSKLTQQAEVLSIGRFCKAFLIVAIGSLFATQPTAAKDTNTSETNKETASAGHTIKHTRLDNGLLVTIYSDPRMPIVTTYVSYHVGSGHEDPELRGLAHLFEHLMFGATTNHKKGELSRYITEHGGSSNAYTSLDETVYWSRIAPEYFEQTLLLEADRMMNLTVTQKGLQTEKRIVLEEMRFRSENNPIDRMFFEGMKAALTTHPYALSPAGNKEDIERVTRKDCLDFYSRYYGPKNAHLIVVGPLSIKSVFQAVEQYFGILANRGTEPPQIPVVIDWSFPEEIILKEDLPPAKISSFGFALPPANSQDYVPIQLMLHLLEGVNGFEDEIKRRRRKAIYADIDHLAARQGQYVLFWSASLPHQRKSQAYKNLEETLQALSEYRWLSSDLLSGAKKILMRNIYREQYSSRSVASRLRHAHWWRGDLRTASTYSDEIAAVKTDEIKHVFETYILNAKKTRFHVVPERIPLFVRAFGWLYPLASRLGIVRYP